MKPDRKWMEELAEIERRTLDELLKALDRDREALPAMMQSLLRIEEETRAELLRALLDAE